MPSKKKTFFSYLNSLFSKKDIGFDKREVPSYLLLLWLSHDPKLIDLTQSMNRMLYTLPGDVIYRYFFDKIPKGRRFIRWTKKEPVQASDKKILEELEQYNLSERETNLYLKHVRRKNESKSRRV